MNNEFTKKSCYVFCYFKYDKIYAKFYIKDLSLLQTRVESYLGKDYTGFCGISENNSNQ